MRNESHNTELIKYNLEKLHVHMYEVSKLMYLLGDKETQEHGKELLNASKLCKEWSEYAKAKI